MLKFIILLSATIACPDRIKYLTDIYGNQVFRGKVFRKHFGRELLSIKPIIELGYIFYQNSAFKTSLTFSKNLQKKNFTKIRIFLRRRSLTKFSFFTEMVTKKFRKCKIFAKKKILRLRSSKNPN